MANLLTAPVVANVVAAFGVLIAVVSYVAARHRSRRAESIAREANGLAARALRLEEDRSRVRLVVEPRLMLIIGEDTSGKPRPVVKVINLSQFPVTIDGIHWRTKDGGETVRYWLNPFLSGPHGSFPARLEPNDALQAVGTPQSFEDLDLLEQVTAAVVFTACGQSFEGMTERWQESVAKMRAEQLPAD